MFACNPLSLLSQPITTLNPALVVFIVAADPIRISLPKVDSILALSPTAVLNLQLDTAW